MQNNYNKNFYDGFCGEDYSNEELWRAQFGNIADKIIEYLAPKTVLDAGCANGYLVSELRKRGVEAYGVDISSYAIESSGEDVRPFLNVQSLTDPLPESFPEKFDLVVTIEVLEHLLPDDGYKAISLLCSYSDSVLFSSTPTDLDNKTHVNVQQCEYWAKLFAKNSFYRNLIQPTDFITPWTMLFQKDDDISNVIFNYELSQRVDILRMAKPKEHTGNLYFDLGNGFSADNFISFTYSGSDLNSGRIALPNGVRRIRIDHIENSYSVLYDLIIATDAGILLPYYTNTVYQADTTYYFSCSDPQVYVDLSTKSCSWIEITAKAEIYASVKDFNGIYKMLDKLRITTDALKENKELKKELNQYIIKCNRLTAENNGFNTHLNNVKAMYDNISQSLFWKITLPFRFILDVIKKFFKKVPPFKYLYKFLKCWKQNGFKYTMRKIRDFFKHRADYSVVRRPLYTPAQLEAQKKERFERDIKFSILVPLYNTPEKFLKEMIQSVLDQTYSNFELCLADGSDGNHDYVKKIVKHYASQDSRIIYKKLEKNMGISMNTNACIEMATGDYIGLFDHDDLLHPALLYEIMQVICNKNADFIYTDENTFHKTPKDAYCPHFKPDYAPDTLRTNNYICHFSCFSKELLDKVGNFRPECDGSQDYDMVLRLTEQAETIVHIPKILYYWRAHAGSVATSIEAKPYVIDAAHKAISDHLQRVGLRGTVEDTVVPSMYKVKYEIEKEALVSIIIANKDHIDDLDKCIKSIFEKTTYPNYEIVIVENNSTEDKTWRYYEEITKSDKVKLVRWDGDGRFNYSAINNTGVKSSSGEYVILLNNDTEIIAPDWIQEMLMFAQREDVGAVGAKLYYPDDTIQHAGVGIGILTLAGHYFKGFPRKHPGYMGRLIYAHNVSAVTAACIMISRRVWDEIEGLDESFAVAFNDIDMCMRIRKAGYLIVMTPFAELYHYESKSRGLDDDIEKRNRFVGEVERFQKRWAAELKAGDPYYNPNFTLDNTDFSIKQ